jgi:hypothetical protein
MLLTIGKKRKNKILTLCDCGKIKVINYYDLINGKIKSCGCWKSNPLAYPNRKKHGHCSKGNTKFYNIWQGIKNRCNNKKYKDYQWYGARGITYDSSWNDFLGFKKDMYFKYIYAKKQLKITDLSIERIDVNGNYCFKNCIFISKSKQSKNRRPFIEWKRKEKNERIS